MSVFLKIPSHFSSSFWHPDTPVLASFSCFYQVGFLRILKNKQDHSAMLERKHQQNSQKRSTMPCAYLRGRRSSTGMKIYLNSEFLSLFAITLLKIIYLVAEFVVCWKPCRPASQFTDTVYPHVRMGGFLFTVLVLISSATSLPTNTGIQRTLVECKSCVKNFTLNESLKCHIIEVHGRQ
jgi:hypothetical protein